MNNKKPFKPVVIVLLMFLVHTTLIVAQDNKGNDEDYYSLGLNSINNKKYADAIGFFNKAIEINNGNTIYFYKRGQAYYELQQYYLAINDFAYCDGILKDESEYPYLIGICFDKLDKTNNALRYYNRAISLDSIDMRYYKCRANLYLRTENYTNAILDYDIIIAQNAKDGSMYYHRGIAKYKLNKLDEACADWQNAMLNNYTDAMYYVSKNCVK